MTTPAPAAALPPRVATLVTHRITNGGAFVARGVVPLPSSPDGPSSRAPALCASISGQLVPFQIDAARWDHSGSISALEVSAFVPDQGPVPWSGPVHIDLALDPDRQRDNAESAPPHSEFARRLFGTGFELCVRVLQPGSSTQAWTYSAQVGRVAGGGSYYRSGALVTTFEVSGRLARRDHSAPFPELLGFTAWITSTAGENAVQITLALDSGRVDGSVLPDFEFDGIELVVPQGVELEHKGPEPLSDGPIELDDGNWAHSLSPTELAQVWFQRQERVWHFALFPTGERPRARQLLDNLGFAVALSGPGLWAWDSPGCCGFNAQEVAPPMLAHLNVGSLIPGSKTSVDKLLIALRDGKPIGGGNSKVGRLGLFHPWGVAYGGMTGGSEIDQLLGVELTRAPDPWRLLEYQLRFARLVDRQRVALYRRDGVPFPLEYVASGGVPDGAVAAKPPAMFNGQFANNPDPFGFWAAQNKSPRVLNSTAYESTLRSFAPIDEQHLVRFTGPAKVLAALWRDPYAIRWLKLEAELSRAHLSEFPGGQLDGWIAQTRSRPRQGGPLGRGEGWVADCVAHAWAYHPRGFRTRFAPWARKFLELVAQSPTPAGIWNRHTSGKSIKPAPFYSAHAVCQTIEHAIVAHGALGLWLATRAEEPQHNVERALVDAATTGIRYLWKPGAGDAYQWVAVAPIAGNAAPYATLPAGLWLNYDSWQLPNVIGYGLALLARRDIAVEQPFAAGGHSEAFAIALSLVSDATGGAANPLTAARSKGWGNLFNRAAFLSALERLK